MNERTTRLRERVAPVIARIANEEGCTVDEIYGFHRDHYSSRARHRAMAVVRWSTRLSLEQIAAIFNRDHTTVLMAIKKYEKEINT